MPLPETVSVRYSEDDAGYVTVRPVIKQNFRAAELADMVVCVTGKDAARVQQIFRVGSVVYNGYHYWWEGFPSEIGEVTALLASFPDDDPNRLFHPASVTAVSLEMGGGTQRILVKIARREASGKRLFHKQSVWEILLRAAEDSAPRYEKYSYEERADVFRSHLSPATSATLLKEVLKASPGGLRKKLAALQPPAALLFFLSRAHPSRDGFSG